MTPQERDLTTILLDRLNKTEDQPKDPEAETLIRDCLEIIPAERLGVTTDCGLINLPRMIAFAKLRSLVEGTKSVCVTPLVSRARVLGVLVVGRTTANPFSADEVDFLTKVAGPIAIAVASFAQK